MKIRICRTPPGIWHVEVQGQGREWRGDGFASRHLALQALAKRLQEYSIHALAETKNGVWSDPPVIPPQVPVAAPPSAKPKLRAPVVRATRRTRQSPRLRDESLPV